MAALFVYFQNTVFRLRERREGQTMAEYALILGGIAIVVILALVFLGGRIRDLFESNRKLGHTHRSPRTDTATTAGGRFAAPPHVHVRALKDSQ